MIEMDKGKESSKPPISRRDVLRGLLAVSLAAGASACAPVKNGDPISPTLTPSTESAPLGDATPFPEGRNIATGEARLVPVKDVAVIAREIENFDLSEVNWYDVNENLQTKTGSESGFVLLGLLDVQIADGLNATTIGYVSGPAGEEHIAQKIDDNRWVVLSYKELPEEPNGKKLNAFGYTSQRRFLPILSVETTASGQPTGEEWFFDISVERFYKINDPDYIGQPGMLSLVRLGNESILKGKSLMKDSRDIYWNFAWQSDGTLSIAGGNHVVLYTYDSQTSQWVEAAPEIKEYQICGVENYKDCVIPVEDLFDGSYLRWLQTLSKPFDNPQNLKVLTSRVQIENTVYFGDWGELNNSFADPKTAPLRRGVTAGYVSLPGDTDYIVLPVEFYNPNSPSGSDWVIAVFPEMTVFEEAGIMEDIKKWTNGKSLPLYTSPERYELLKRSFRNYPDLAQRVQEFADTGDPSSLSMPGIILKTHFAH
jgi:hypothetical protein